ncbi:MAG: NAD(P)-dependent oxidoreductase [Candidatus Methylomirabilis sp.]|nr:NAD(P)-dependent oxidoreductase [Deltaproteobacteria bacterium]
MSRFILTGASGHLGRAILTALLNDPQAEVVALVGRASSAKDLESAFPTERVRVETTPLGSSTPVIPLEGRYDSLVHCAALIPPAGPERVHFESMYRVNALGFADLLAALGDRIGHCTLVSSIAVYAQPTGVREVLDESSSCRPNTFYGASKLAAETIGGVWARREGRGLAILRVASVYGPGETQVRALPNFIELALRGEPIRLNGLGSARRNYAYVGDAARAVAQCAARRVEGLANLAGREVFTTERLAREIIRLTGSASPVLRFPGASDDLVFDVRRASERFGIECPTPLSEGLSRQIAWRQAGSPGDFSAFTD